MHMPCEVMKNASFVAFEQMRKLMNNKIISFLINILHEHHLSISKDPDVQQSYLFKHFHPVFDLHILSLLAYDF